MTLARSIVRPLTLPLNGGLPPRASSGSSTSTWDISGSGHTAGVTFSGDLLTASVPDGAQYYVARNTQSHSAFGVYQFEITIDDVAHNLYNGLFGLIDSTYDASQSARIGVSGGIAASWGNGSGQFWLTGGVVGSATQYTTPCTVGAVLTIDGANDKLDFYDALGNKVGTIALPLGKAWFIGITMFGAGSTAKINTGQTAFAHAVGGAVAWG